MNGSSLPAALCRTPAIQPAETRSPVMSPMSCAARPTGMCWALARFAARACASGPYWARPVIRAGACPALTAPQRPHARPCTWYSVTLGGGGGTISNSCSFWVPVTGAPARSASHRPQAAGAHTMISSGSATWRSVEDSAPGCFPGLRPLRPRSDRSLGFFLYGLSDDGGFDDVEESLPRRRSISATRSLSAAILASAASRAALAAASCASRASMTSRSRALDARRVATRARSSSPAGSGGRSGTSYHDQDIRMVIKPTRWAGSRKITTCRDYRPCNRQALATTGS